MLEELFLLREMLIRTLVKKINIEIMH